MPAKPRNKGVERPELNTHTHTTLPFSPIFTCRMGKRDSVNNFSAVYISWSPGFYRCLRHVFVTAIYVILTRLSFC